MLSGLAYSEVSVKPAPDDQSAWSTTGPKMEPERAKVQGLPLHGHIQKRIITRKTV